jgi:hypothetical protein
MIFRLCSVDVSNPFTSRHTVAIQLRGHPVRQKPRSHRDFRDGSLASLAWGEASLRLGSPDKTHRSKSNGPKSGIHFSEKSDAKTKG